LAPPGPLRDEAALLNVTHCTGRLSCRSQQQRVAVGFFWLVARLWNHVRGLLATACGLVLQPAPLSKLLAATAVRCRRHFRGRWRLANGVGEQQLTCER
jgi:hypothetical protein